jgi:hypothetical protein
MKVPFRKGVAATTTLTRMPTVSKRLFAVEFQGTPSFEKKGYYDGPVRFISVSSCINFTS